MLARCSLTLASTCLAVFAGLRAGVIEDPVRGAEPPAVPADPYPPTRHPSVLRFFSLEGDPDLEAIRTALAKEKSTAAACRLVAGPHRCAQRVGRSFVAVEAPADLDVKAILLALRKGARGADELAWTAFHNAELDSADAMHWAPQSVLAGSTPDLRWGDGVGGWYQFFHLPGKIDAREIEERFDTLLGRSIKLKIGKVVCESFTWPLRGPVDEAAARRAKSLIAKLPGVRKVDVDAAGARLEVVVELAGLRASGPPRPYPHAADVSGRASGAAPVCASFDTNPVFDLLAKQSLAVVEKR